MDSSEVDRVLDASKRNLHCKVKRVYNVECACTTCNAFTVVNDKCISYICKKCSKYNSVPKAIKNFEDGNAVFEESKSYGIAPAIKSGGEYSMLRDEMEIRADFFAKGKTRTSMGVDNFSNKLRKELVKNKCYRGPDKTGV